MKTANLFNELCELVNAHQVPFRATVHAPDSWGDLCAWHKQNAPAPIPVYDVSNDPEIVLPRVHDNHAFRAWHDTLHLMLHADFRLNGERCVADAHANAARNAGASVHCAALAYLVSLSNVAYWYATKGKHLQRPRQFIVRAFENWLHGNDARGYDAAIRKTIWETENASRSAPLQYESRF